LQYVLLKNAEPRVCLCWINRSGSSDFNFFAAFQVALRVVTLTAHVKILLEYVIVMKIITVKIAPSVRDFLKLVL
jgi:hypothetical protein